MKIVMSIDEYQAYKNNEITIWDLRKRDINKAINNVSNCIFKHKIEISLVLSVIAANTLNLKA